MRSATPAGLDGKLLEKLYKPQLYIIFITFRRRRRNFFLCVKFQLVYCSESYLISYKLAFESIRVFFSGDESRRVPSLFSDPRNFRKSWTHYFLESWSLADRITTYPKHQQLPIQRCIEMYPTIRYQSLDPRPRCILPITIQAFDVSFFQII